LTVISIVIITFNREEKLKRLLDSIYSSNLENITLEVIVVDDSSPVDYSSRIHSLFPNVEIIRNDEQLLVSGCRNIGFKAAKGDFIFFIDDDNVLEKNCISELSNSFLDQRFKSLGMVAPIMFYYSKPERIWCAGVQRNMATSITSFYLRDHNVSEVKEKYLESTDFPNAFMIKRSILNEIGGFNETDYPIHYEESDIAARIIRNGNDVVCNTDAKSWHDILPPDGTEDPARLYHVHNALRAYYSGRNRIVFHKEYSDPFDRMLFLTFFSWGINLYYTYIILFRSKTSLGVRSRNVQSYFKGVLDGLSGRYRDQSMN